MLLVNVRGSTSIFVLSGEVPPFYSEPISLRRDYFRGAWDAPYNNNVTYGIVPLNGPLFANFSLVLTIEFLLFPLDGSSEPVDR